MFAFEQAISFVYFSNKFRLKRKRWVAVLSYLATFSFQFALNYLEHPEVNMLTFFTCNILLSFFIFNASLKQSFFHVLLLEVLMGITEFITMYGASVLGIASLEMFNANPNVMLLETFTSKAMYFLTAYLSSKLSLQKGRKEKDDFSLILFILPLNSVLILFAFTYLTTHSVVDYFSQTVFIIVAMITLATNLIVAFVHERVVLTLKSNTQYQLELQKVEINSEYYKELEQQNDLASILLHDIKRHLTVINALSVQGDNFGIQDYIRSVQESESVKTIKTFSENKLINVIVSRYANRCLQESIDFHCDIRHVDFSFIEPSDLTSLLDNLLENAVEAASQSAEKMIDLVIEEKNEQFVLIKLTNSADIPPKHTGQVFRSTKKDAERHGLGLKSIRNITKQYEGEAEFYYSEIEKQFTASIFLRLS